MSEKTYKQRINNIIGQLNGISKMLDNKNNCEEVLIQLKSVKSAMSSMMNKIIENEFDYCIEKNDLSKDSLKKLLKNLNN